MSASADPRHGWQRKGGPVMMRSTVSLFIRKFTPGDATLRRDVPFAMGVRGFLTNSQFTKHLKTVLTFSRHMVI